MSTDTLFQFSNRSKDSRFWCIIDCTSGSEIDEIFIWAKQSDVDILCMGLTELNVDSEDNIPRWFSVWSFEKDEDRTIFILKFGSNKTIIC